MQITTPKRLQPPTFHLGVPKWLHDRAGAPHLLLLPRQTALLYLAILGAGFLLYFLCWPAAPAIRVDSLFYLEAAWDLADGVLADIPYRTIGYPLLLLASGSVPNPGRALYFVQLTLHVTLIWLGGAILYRAGASRRILIAFAVVMLLPPFAQITALVLPESLAELCLMAALAAFYFFLRRPERTVLAAVSALASGYAALTRPGFLMLSPVMAALALAPSAVAVLRHERFRFRRQITGAVLMAAIPLLMVLSYSAYNWRRFGYFGPTPLLGHNLMVRTTPFYQNIPDPEMRRLLLEARNRRYSAAKEPELAIADVNAELLSMAKGSRVELARRLQQAALHMMRSKVLEYAREVARTFAAFWVPETDYNEGMAWRAPASGPVSFAIPEGRLGDYRARVLPMPRPLIALWVLVELTVMLLFFGCAVLFAGLAAGSVLGCLRVPWRPPTALTYAACVLIVIYNAFICAAVDRGAPHQRECTEAFIVLSVFLAFVMLRDLRREGRTSRELT